MLAHPPPTNAILPAVTPVVLITGASSGLGRETARHLAGAGYRVYGTSRKPAARELPYSLIPMDVCCDESVRAAVAGILETEGRIDVVVNNAGISVTGSVEDVSLDEARQQFETNFFGVLRVVQVVLPSMREHRAGKIINVGSIGGMIGLPFQGLYSATKFALEGLTEALRMEVAAFGIHVTNVNPGDFRTEMTENRILAAAAARGAYAEQLRKTLEVYERDERRGGDPIRVARLIGRIIREPAPRVRYLVGAFDQRAGARLKPFLGSRLFERLMKRHSGIE